MSKGARSLSFYLMMILLFGSLMYVIVQKGESRQLEETVLAVEEAPKNLGDGYRFFNQSLLEHIESPISILLLQIIVILIMCRIFRWMFQKLGQPTVIGEITAGIVLGPSILGNLMPEVSAFLFPPESLGNIMILSQFGLILFMFTLGMELDISEVKKRFRETILISHTSTIVPFFFGILTAYFVYDTYADKNTPFLSFSLFIGIAMSITAFPVLARIIQEKGLTRSYLGTLTLTSAANGDITAWCLLAVVVAIAQAGTMVSAVFNILFSIVYILFMFFAVRSFLQMVGNIYHNKEVVDKGLVAFMFLILIVSSCLTEILGLHALFGAFIAGMVMPGNVKFRKIMTEKVEDVSLALFLPLFFVSTGLRTEIGLLNSAGLWWMCLMFIVVAVIGKFGGAFVSARFVGESWKNSLYIGALMNTRGLMELVVLTIGYEMGILPPSIFVMLVLMTLVTTFMTVPLLSFIQFCFRAGKKIKEQRIQAAANKTFKVLLSFGRAGNGQIMLDVAHQMFARGEKKLDLTALHLTVGTDVNPLHTDNFQEVSFKPILYGAKKLGIHINTWYEVSNNASNTICNIVNNEGFDFLLVGAGIAMSNQSDDIAADKIFQSFYNRIFKRFKAPQSWFYPSTLLKDKTKMFIEGSHCDVGVFVNRGFVRASNIILVINSLEDLFLLDYVSTLLQTTHGAVAILNRVTPDAPEYNVVAGKIIEYTQKVRLSDILPEKELVRGIFHGYNFMLISYPTWNIVSECCKEALQQMPSTLIINKKTINNEETV